MHLLQSLRFLQNQQIGKLSDVAIKIPAKPKNGARVSKNYTTYGVHF